MSCEHARFSAEVKVTRLTDEEDGPVTGYAADVRVTCKACKTPFRFVGLPGGYHPAQPTSSVFGDAARLPMEPIDDPRVLRLLAEVPVQLEATGVLAPKGGAS